VDNYVDIPDYISREMKRRPGRPPGISVKGKRVEFRKYPTRSHKQNHGGPLPDTDTHMAASLKRAAESESVSLHKPPIRGPKAKPPTPNAGSTSTTTASSKPGRKRSAEKEGVSMKKPPIRKSKETSVDLCQPV